MKLIDKAALVADIERRENICKKVVLDLRTEENKDYYQGKAEAYKETLDLLDTIEVKEVDIAISNIDDIFEEDGIDPYSKDAKLFKECYYTALERYKEKKGIV